MTEEEAKRAVIDAALAVCGDWPTAVSQYDYGLRDAVDAYRKATAPPEPFEAYVGYGGDSILDSPAVYDEIDDYDPTRKAIWRCTVTPTERVR